MLIKVPPGWRLPESSVTDEAAYMNRRQLLRTLGLASGGLLAGCGLEAKGLGFTDVAGFVSPYEGYFPVSRNAAYQVEERSLTDEGAATTYNNFYEFTTTKEDVWKLVGAFEIAPWTLKVSGLCNKPGTYDIEDLLARFPMEERIYRFRCVEAWAMTVPWSGFPLRDLISFLEPASDATHVQFVSAFDPDQMPGIDIRSTYPWPYHEGLRLDEAANELALMAVGIYGRALPRQNGAPMRLVLPWKYGYKSIKSVVELVFVSGQPSTFWNTQWPEAYGFLSNVDPTVPHPGWSQATEQLIPNGETIETQLYNGYGAYVADLYG